MASSRLFSLKTKIQLLTFLIGLLVSVVCFSYVTIKEWQEFRNESVSRLQVLTRILANTVAVPLAFIDAEAGTETLDALRAQKTIVRAHIHTPQGELLASYHAPGFSETGSPHQLTALEHDLLTDPEQGERIDWSMRRLEIGEAVYFGNRLVGMLTLVADLSQSLSDMYEDILFAGGLLCCLMLGSWWLAKRLQGVLMRPISALIGTMDEVSKQKDYSLRVPVLGHDELAVLSKNFNDMLRQIEIRDARLLEHSEQLEKQVAQRTVDLERAADEAHRLAFFDTLTGLPNRRSLIEKFNAAVDEARESDSSIALLFLDLDRFKRINDTLGHHIGDELLIAVAERIKHCLRTCDTVSRLNNSEPACISRLGGDEFVVFLTGLSYAQQSAQISQRIIQAVRQPLTIQGHTLTVTTSIGISLFPEDGEDVTTLLKHADAAMYHAKAQGKNNYQYYRAELNATSMNRLALENDLRQALALDRNQFEMYFQPQFDTHGGRITGAEALIRWKHPEQGLLSPDDFIPVAEECGLIVPLGQWVFQEVCSHIIIWKKMGLEFGTIGINLSGAQMLHPQMVAGFADILVSAKVNPVHLQIELTESMLMETSGDSIDVLHQLKALGIQLAIDDFGKGYSSLTYLKSFPIDVLKIDRAFIRGLPQDVHNAAITRAIVVMAHSLGLKVIAEGVEKREHYEFLRDLYCNEVQGFLFARPMPAAQFEQLLINGQPFGGNGEHLLQPKSVRH